MDDWWDSSQIAAADEQRLRRALQAIRDRQSAAAIDYANQCEPSEARDLVLGYAYDRAGQKQQAVRILASALLNLDSRLTEEGRRRMLSLLSDAATEVDIELAEVLEDPWAVVRPEAISRVVKSFFFGGGLGRQPTLYQQVLAQKKEQEARSRRERRARTLVYQIEFLKCYSSSTHLTEDDGASLGGGYFLTVNKFGCVIDPGYNFLTNFLKAHRIADIDAIVVTHAHDDHNADLPALLSLLYRQKDRKHKVQLLLDRKTYAACESLIQSSHYVQKPCRPIAASWADWAPERGGIELAETLSMQPIPAQHKLTPQDEGGSAVGLHFVLRNGEQVCHLVVSGDTAWVPHPLKDIYRSFARYHPVLVVHASTACKEEAQGVLAIEGGAYHPNHLGIRGTVEMISACSPSKVILSEIGEELGHVVHPFAALIQKAFGVPCLVGMMNDAEGSAIDLVPHLCRE